MADPGTFWEDDDLDSILWRDDRRGVLVLSVNPCDGCGQIVLDPETALALEEGLRKAREGAARV